MAFSEKTHQGVIWMDGHIRRSDEATVSVLSHGLNYSTSVFEGIRVYSGTALKLEEHISRFRESARLLGFPLPYGEAELCDAARQVVSEQGLQNAYIRPLAWKGHESISITGPGTTTHAAIAAMPMGDIFGEEVRKAGLRLQVSKWKKPGPEMAPVKAKAACHYTIAHLAINEAKAAGFDDALLLDGRGDIAESSGSNFFIVRNGRIITPFPECALDGITRRTVMDLARKRGIETREARIRPEDLVAAEEAFLTGTAYEVVPVRSVGDIVFSGPRTVTDALMRDYFSLVGREIT